ncbi:glycosyltransferase involved in cell wall biosynthesis [Frigoribacterium sp. PhB160]|uniref:glycosyltransferase n=1 Tax=Frigoribacterium sp. PhB160 TaxID=2485192 RepID=UPI000F495727|nr:glycosyltransferase [Frigoribacterium sp. PhB160]ROS61336.1 glycosyltransferase involved in cell wall biosynthesis [Frigoribacterium sp. PhB160]
MGIQTSLDAVHQAAGLVESMRLADDLAFEAARTGGTRTIRLLTGALGSTDQLVAIAATHALAQVHDEQADVALSGVLSSDRAFLREHAAWALSSRLPRPETVGRLLALVVEGGFAGMLAQRTLEQWSDSSPGLVAVAVEGGLIGIRDPEARYRLVETLGLVRDRIATRPLLVVAADEAETEHVRVAAVSALGQRRGAPGVALALEAWAEGEGYLADVARLALVDLSATPVSAAPVSPTTRDADDDRGLTVAQLFLHADIDAELTAAGSGDNGGIATLLVRLGDALVADADPATRAAVRRVVTLSRGSAAGALDSVAALAADEHGHVFGRVPLLSEPVPSAAAWPLRVAARRGIRRVLRATGGVDVLHLRMADVGSLAAADVARELDVPVVFTVAPDPHAVIQSMDLAGGLTRENFGEVDEREHFWFRARLVQQLASNASHTVLFPRPELATDLRDLVGIDITAHPERHSVVPEGIDLQVVDRAVSEAAAHAAGQPATPPLAELRELLEGLPAERRDLPLVVSVGRFHRVKGMATIADAWARGPLRDQANLLLIGGALDDPSPDEREQLDLIDALVPRDRRRASGLLLPGHRPNDTVARWVAAARFGVPGLAAPRGVYVCGSLKEEFGIALLEAMGTGLFVVAPDGGGPSTYVERGVTGVLTRTWDVEQLADAVARALELSTTEPDDARAARSRATVERSFTIQAMAAALSTVYVGVHRDEVASLDGAWLR